MKGEREGGQCYVVIWCLIFFNLLILTRVVSKVDLFTFDVIVSTAVSVVNSDVISATKSTEKRIEKINVASKPLLLNRQIVMTLMLSYQWALRNETLKFNI
jgi:hypothetical protein